MRHRDIRALGWVGGFSLVRSQKPVASAEAGSAVKALLGLTKYQKQSRQAAALGWSESKLSRILNGRQAPSPESLDEVAVLLKREVEDDAGVPADLVEFWMRHSTQPPPDSDSRRVMHWAVGAILAVLAVGAVAFWWIGVTGRRSSAVEGLTPCVFEPGETDAQSRESLEPYSEAFRGAYAELSDTTPFGCPSSEIRRWQRLVVQDLAVGERRGGAIVAASPEEVVVLSASAWQSFLQIGGGGGDEAQAVGGLPVASQTRNGYHIIDLDTGGRLVGTHIDAPHFWMPELAIGPWTTAGEFAGLGAPTGNPVTRNSVLVQDYERGMVVMDQSGRVAVEWVDVPPSQDAVLDYEGQIVRHTDGTGWLVRSGMRWWIPDREVWACLDDGTNTAPRELAGWTIFALEYGGWAGCPGG